MRKVLLAMLCTCLFIACGGNVGKEGDKAQKERDLAARQQLQGVWIDDNTRLPMLRIKDDSIFSSIRQVLRFASIFQEIPLSRRGLKSLLIGFAK